MWNMVIIAIMASLAGLTMLPTERMMNSMEDMKGRETAETMGLYRQAVVDYFTAHPTGPASVNINTLKSAGVVPTWSTLYTDSANVVWRNYRNGTDIYIYPATIPERNIIPELLELSRQSVTVGVYRASDSSLYSPVDNQRITLALSGVTIPDGAPVWMAARN